jgi:hypothetical protein
MICHFERSEESAFQKNPKADASVLIFDSNFEMTSDEIGFRKPI